MLKLTQYMAILLLGCSWGCKNQPDAAWHQQQFHRRVDSAAEARIDSAYAAIQRRCDSLLTYQVPHTVDSIVKAQDSISHIKTVKK